MPRLCNILRVLSLIAAILISTNATASITAGPSPNLNGNYTVSWTVATNTQWSELSESTDGGNTWPNVYQVYLPATSISFSGRSPGTYTYKVKKCHTGGHAGTVCNGVNGPVSVLVEEPIPPTPTGLSGPGTDYNGAYTVNWNSSAGAASYKLQQRLGSGSWSQVYSGTSTSKAITGNSAGTYSYRVQACNPTSSCSGWSSTVSVTVQAPPSTPGGLSGPGTDYNGAYTISWNSSTHSTSYRLQQQLGSGSWSQIYSGSGTSKAISGNSAGTYSYRVRGCNPESVCSGWSSTVSVTVQAPPSVPGGLSGPGTDYNGSYTVNWNASTNSTSYRLQQKLGAGSWSQIYSGSGTSKAITGNSAGIYSYRVRGCNPESVCSGWSGTTTVTVPDPPAAPSGLSGPDFSIDGSYTISWSAVSGAASYRLQEKPDPGSWTQIYSGPATEKNVSGQSDGTYQYKVRACNVESACGNWSSSVHTVQVATNPPPPPTPPAPGPNVDPGQASTVTSDSIGTTAGNFRVDESGAATYSVPIASAAGTAGVAPQISLNYSSSAGNGVAGLGWSIGGLSSIARCRQTYDQDRDVTPVTWTDDDRFCLDGQRLLLVSGASYGAAGSTYRTEIDGGVIVTAVGSAGGEPDYFEAYRKDGSTTYYGKSPNSSDTSAKLANTAGNTLTWGIREFQDSVGNSIWFKYDSGSGYQRIDEIRYAFGSATGPLSGYGARIAFAYESRADALAGFVAGHLFENDQRLKTISAYNVVGSEALIRQYKLTYNESISTPYDDLSRLTGIEECVGGVCLPKTVFDWNVPNVSASLTTLGTLSMGSSYAAFTPADINGDGRMDIAWLEGSSTQRTLKYALSTGSGFTNGLFSSGTSSISVTTTSTFPRLQAIDYNLDGRQEIIYYDGNADRWKVLLSKPNGTSGWRLSSTSITTPVESRHASFVDVDSNGTTDAVYKHDGVPSNTLYLRRLEPSGAGASSALYFGFGAEIAIAGSGGDDTIGAITALAGDFDGDGQVDIAMGGEEEQCDEDGRNCLTVRNYGALTFSGFSGNSPAVSSYVEFPGSVVVINGQTQIHFPDMDALQAIDINADGLTDAFYPVHPFFGGDPSEYSLQINDGAGGLHYQEIADTSLNDPAANPQFTDWNMDGYQDLVWRDISGSGSIKIRYWNPGTQALDSAQTLTTGVSSNSQESDSFFDVNGDGAPDLVKFNSGGTLGSVIVMTRSASGQPANRAVNRITAIANGLGATTQLNYEALSYTDHYTRLELSSSPATETVCKKLGIPGEENCWEEDVEVANTADFYTAINGPWFLPQGAQTLGKNESMPVLELSGPMYVVTEVEGDAPSGGASPGNVDTSATSSIRYYYSEAKMQAAGRGFLGFQRLTTIDDQTGVETTTRYRQDWPFIGNPIYTEVESSTGYKISENSTEWELIEWTGSTSTTAQASGTAALGSVHVVESYSSEKSYDLLNNGNSQGSLTSSASTESVYDDEGNPIQIVVTTRAGNGNTIKEVESSNTYLDDSNFTLFEARLSNTNVVTTYNGISNSPGRESVFDYYTGGAYRGLLHHEIVEPNNANFTLTTTHSYDAYGNRIKSSASDGSTTRCNVNAAVYDASGRYVNSSYDCLGRLTETVAARNEYGSPTAIHSYVDTNGTDYVTTLISYSAMGREYYRYTNTGAWKRQYLAASQSYCPAGTIYTAITIDATGAETQECYDSLGRSIRAMARGFNGSWNAQDTEYGPHGQVLRKSEPFIASSGAQVAPYWTTLGYDLLDRVTLTTLADNSTAVTIYNGLATTITNDHAQSHTELRDAAGLLVQVTDNLNGVTQFVYDGQGNMTQMTDPASNQTTIQYDLLGRKIHSSDPDKGNWSYDYNHYGELVEQTDALGQSQTMTYDGLGRMVTRVDTGSTNGSSSWTYDTAAYGLGQLASVQDSQTGYARAVLYDSFGRADEVITSFDGDTYYQKTTYDSAGRVYQSFDAAGDGSFTDMGTANHYNNYGYLEAVADAVEYSGTPRKTYRQIVSINARGQVTQEYRGIDNFSGGSQPSVSALYDYSPATGRLLSIDSINAQGQDVQDLDYAWDTLGNLTSRQEMSGSKNLSESFTYDGLNRLVTQSVAGQSTVTIAYNAIGNITSKSDVGSYSYGAGSAGPHAVTAAGGATYGYDLNGNNTSGDGRSITYSSFDKPTQIGKGGHTTSFAYDPDRNRYRRIDSGSGGTTTTRYIGNVEIVFKANGDQDRKRYIAGVAVETVHFGGNSVEDYRETHYLHKDHLGSLDVVTDESGAVIQELSFDAWGQRRDATDWTALGTVPLQTFDHGITTRGYTGHEMLDEVGLIHMNGRIYDPKLGRFLQADPFVQDPSNTQSLNRYSYVLNNPLNATDPSGYFSLKDLLKVVAVVAVSVVTYGAAAGAVYASYGVTGSMAAAGCVTTNIMIGAGVAGGVAAGFAAGVSMAAFSGQSFGDALQAGVTGALTGAVTGGFGGYLRAAGHTNRLARGISGGINGVVQTGDVEGFARGFLAGQLATDLGIKSYQSSPYTNFAVNRTRDAVQGYLIDGKRGAKSNTIGGIINDGIGHAVGIATSYMENRQFEAPNFRDGMYFYDSGNSIRKFGAEAITIGNVVSGPRQLYSGAYASSRYGQWLDAHEKGHYSGQSSLGPAYLPVQILSQWGSFAAQHLGADVDPFMEYGPFHPMGYETLNYWIR